MKEQIVAKLFNNEELSNDELVFISRNLHDSTHNALTFDHSKSDIMQACGLTQADFDALNKMMEAQMEKCNDGEGSGFSKHLENFESVALSNPKFLRIILMNHIKLMMQSRHPILSLLLGGLGGRI